MEPFVFSILMLVIILGVLYFLIRAAVRDGMLAYDQIKRQEEQAGEQGQSQPNEKANEKEEG